MNTAADCTNSTVSLVTVFVHGIADFYSAGKSDKNPAELVAKLQM